MALSIDSLTYVISGLLSSLPLLFCIFQDILNARVNSTFSVRNVCLLTIILEFCACIWQNGLQIAFPCKVLLLCCEV